MMARPPLPIATLQLDLLAAETMSQAFTAASSKPREASSFNRCADSPGMTICMLANWDFISRVAGDIGKKGRVQLETGTAPAPQVPAGSELRPSTAVQPASPMEQLVHSLAPAGNYSEADIETLVQTITDQSMESVI